jgi:hypothetical protein
MGHGYIAHSLIASHRPLQGFPADAAFHLPDPAFLASCPFAYAPLRETLIELAFPTLPETSSGPDTFPSKTDKRKWATCSQFPAFVSTVTSQLPSYGICACAVLASKCVSSTREPSLSACSIRFFPPTPRPDIIIPCHAKSFGEYSVDAERSGACWHWQHVEVYQYR